MSTVAKAWKDPVFRATLDDADLAALPTHPVGTIGAIGDDTDLAEILGGDHRPFTFHTCITCHWTCVTCWGC